VRTRPDVVLLDLALPDRPGSEVCSTILEHVPDTVAIVLSALADAESVRGAFDAGARAFLVKDATDLDLPDAIRRALNGESMIDPRAASALLGGLARRAHESPRLSQQEIKILQLVAQGLTNPEIGARLYLSRHTVKEYLGHAMRKLNAGSRVAAALEAHRRGLIALPKRTPESELGVLPRRAI
jgi:DNA-binding NarL/FixJ family response regulator